MIRDTLKSPSWGSRGPCPPSSPGCAFPEQDVSEPGGAKSPGASAGLEVATGVPCAGGAGGHRGTRDRCVKRVFWLQLVPELSPAVGAAASSRDWWLRGGWGEARVTHVPCSTGGGTQSWGRVTSARLSRDAVINNNSVQKAPACYFGCRRWSEPGARAASGRGEDVGRGPGGAPSNLWRGQGVGFQLDTTGAVVRRCLVRFLLLLRSLGDG